MKNYFYFLLPKILLLLIIGILIGDKIIINENFFILILSIIFLLTLLIPILSKHIKNKLLINLLCVLIITFLGVALKINKNLIFINYEKIINTTNNFTFKITSNYKETAKTYKYEAQIINKTKRYPKVILYFKKENHNFLEKGSIISTNSKIFPITNSDNINFFNYKTYCFRNSIGYYCFLNDNDVISKDLSKTNFINLPNRIQKLLLKKLWRNNNNELYNKIAGAIVLGENNLDKQTREYFSTSGTIHVLCVSGLHITLIYSVIYLLFSLINIKVFRKIINPILSLIVLWFYASITGFSPSVCRASFMITFITLCKLLKRDSNSFLILCGAAFLMILINPNIIFNIGFKLSHLAVLGIIASKPIADKADRLCKKLKNKYLKKLTTKFIQGVIISIFAQMFIVPILIYHFKTFSNYFIFGNIIAIPLASIILYIGFLLLLIPTSFLFDLLSKIFYFLISILYQTALYINMLPFSVSVFRNFSFIQMIIYALIIYWFLSFIEKDFSFKRLKVFLISFNTIIFVAIGMNIITVFL
ncbi:MAG: ComEC/Rec2 family competence protein [Bacteroidales bacterium]|jgi:competence protein ComEC